MPLSDVLPMLENMGVTVAADRSYEIQAPAAAVWIHEYQLKHGEGEVFDADAVRAKFQDASRKSGRAWLTRAMNWRRWHSELTLLVLKAATEPGEDLVDRRSGPFRDALKRYHHLLGEIGNAARCDLAMVTVALGELRALARCDFANAAHGS